MEPNAEAYKRETWLTLALVLVGAEEPSRHHAVEVG
jgi:hypothetical protein